jgi:outer membrane autotransporter protein
MKNVFILPILGSAVVAFSPLAVARQIVVLPGVVGAVGVTSGVDTQGPGTLSVGSQDINTANDPGGAITTDAANTASIVFSGTSAVTGFVGKTGTTFLNISAGTNANTVTFGGPVFSTKFSVAGTGTVNFNGGFTSNTGSTLDFAGDGAIIVAAGQTVKAAVTNSAGANTGTLTLSGNSILDGAVGAGSGLKQINVVGGNALITGQVKAATYNLGTNTLNVAGAFAIPVAGTINTTIFSLSNYGKIVPVGAATIGNALQINVNVTGPIANGSSFNIVDATSGTSGSTVTATANTTRYLFTAAPTTNGLVRITTTQIPLAVVVTPVLTPAPGAPPVINPVVPVVVAPVIDTLPLTPVTTPLVVAITLLPTAPAVANALAQLGPGTATFASPQVAYRVTQRFQETLESHLENAQQVCSQPYQSADRERRGYDETSACQPVDMKSHWWVTALGYFGEQRTEKGFEGYDSHILGAMLGYDTPINDTTRVGGGVRYGRSLIEAKNSDSENRINSYQAIAYIGYAPGQWFANASLVYGRDDYLGSRHVVFPGINATATADYDGHQFTGFGAAGYHFIMGDGKTVLTPNASIQYTALHTNGYTETGSDAIDLKVNAQNYDFVQSGLGLKLSHAVALSDTQLMRPEIHFDWLHSFGGETMKNTAQFTSGGAAFASVGLKPNRNVYDAGAGVVFASAGAWSLQATYDYQWRNDSYSAHQAMIRLAFHV